MDNKIKEYEKRLKKDRMELDELLDENYMDCSEVVKNKLKFFSQEMEYLENQLSYIKKVEKYEEVVSKESTETNKASTVENAFNSSQVIDTNKDNYGEKVTYVIQTNKIPKVAREPQLNGMMNTKRNSIITNNEKIDNTNKEDSKDLESMVGKSLMGVFASILIFISLILFATVIIPQFNDTAKMCMMYLVSLAFLGIGLYMIMKDDQNPFNLALAGCGIGAVYISLIVSNVYFKIFGDIVLFILIAIWAVGVCFLSKFKNEIFQIIGLSGIVISMIFGCTMCVENQDTSKFVALIIFYIISSTVFYVVHYNKNFHKNAINIYFNLVNMICLLVSCAQFEGESIIVAKIIILIFMLVHMGLALYSKIYDESISYGIYMPIATTFLICQVGLIIGSTELKTDSIDMLVGIIGWLICAVVLVIIEWKTYNNDIGVNIANGVLSLIAMFCLLCSDTLYTHGIVLMLIIPLIFLGFYRQRHVYEYISLALLLSYIFNYDIAYIEKFIFGLITLACIYILMYLKKEQYTKVFVLLLHILTVLFLFIIPKEMISEVAAESGMEYMVSYLLTTVFNVIMMVLYVRENKDDETDDGKLIYIFINAIMMFTGLVYISMQLEPFAHFVIICVTIIAFMINVKRFLDNQESLVGGVYVGCKFTILLIVILASFEAPNFMFSIGCFVISIISIMIGTRFKYKSLRVYGLVLSMISIVKLIMIDIDYDNTVGNALSFFISGLLCFAISRIYDYIDKKVQDDEE